MSPEQARGEPTDERTDLYALGVILYQMLTGEKLYVGETTQAILDQHTHAPLPRLPSSLGANQPLLDRLLAKDAARALGERARAHGGDRADSAAGGIRPGRSRRSRASRRADELSPASSAGGAASLDGRGPRSSSRSRRDRDPRDATR